MEMKNRKVSHVYHLQPVIRWQAALVESTENFWEPKFKTSKEIDDERQSNFRAGKSTFKHRFCVTQVNEKKRFIGKWNSGIYNYT